MAQIYPTIPKENETLPVVTVTEKQKSKPIFKQKLIKIFIQIIVFYFVIAAVAFTILCLRYCITKYLIKNLPFELPDIRHFVAFFVTSITIFSFQLSLPFTIAVIFRNFVKKMKSDNILVKNILTFGSLDGVKNVICSSQYLCGEDISAVIPELEKVGVSVKIISTDNYENAKAHGISVGILKHGGSAEYIMDRTEFYSRVCDSTGKFSQTLFDQTWPKLRILANAEPFDSLFLIKSKREKVAFIGNDLKALQAADFGFTSNFEFSKNNIIIIDHDFNTIFKAFSWSQHISDTVINIIEYQLSISFICTILSLVGSLTVNSNIISFIQYIWINIITFIISFFAFTSLPANENLTVSPNLTKSFITGQMIKHILFFSLFPLIILITLIFLGDIIMPFLDNGRISPPGTPPSKHFTFIFNIFVLLILFNGIFHRQKSEHTTFKKFISFLFFTIAWILIIILQIIIVQFGGEAFSTAPLEWFHWVIGIIMANGEYTAKVIISTCVKMCQRRSTQVQPTCEIENVENDTSSKL